MIRHGQRQEQNQLGQQHPAEAAELAGRVVRRLPLAEPAEQQGGEAEAVHPYSAASAAFSAASAALIISTRRSTSSTRWSTMVASSMVWSVLPEA